jgi:peptidoglycan glycosyltransferase
MDGTADSVDFGDLTVYGKTGTAEYTSNKSMTHSWFVGYATDDNGKKLAIAVIMEGAGYGSKYAAPTAAKVFNAYFD